MSDTKTIQRSFILGDEWCYFKIYTGFKTADTILTDCIYPLAVTLETNHIIDKWFFIRYTDPKFHLRVRFHVSNLNHIPAIITHFNRAVKKYVENDLVWKVQADTYNRELERYGEDTIELSETLFHHDSMAICRLVASDAVKQDENKRWLLGLKMIDTLLNGFDFSLQEKLNLANTLQENFGKEFGISKEYRYQFGQKYRNEKSNIEKILHPNAENSEEYKSLFETIFEKTKRTQSPIQEIKLKISENEQLPLNNLVSSYIHMMLNRLFRTQQRAHELVLYDYLSRYYTSLNARQQNK